MTISIIGAGNLATNIAQAIKEKGHNIQYVFSRTMESAKKLADIVHASPTDSISDIKPGADIYIIAVKDSALPDVAQKLVKNLPNQLLVHTAGSIDMDVIKANRRGVLYPMQTFSKFKKVDFNNIHCFIEAENINDLNIINQLATSISDCVHQTDSQKRKILHLAAVFACNFANHCEAIAEKILQDYDISFEVMKPLIKETFDKIMTTSPKVVQTGPAARNDKNVMDMHAKILQQRYGSQIETLYKQLSNSIQNLI